LTTLTGVRDNVVGTFDDAMAGMPEMVESGSWYTRWYSLVRT
jgi:hypothetical protein